MIKKADRDHLKQYLIDQLGKEKPVIRFTRPVLNVVGNTFKLFDLADDRDLLLEELKRLTRIIRIYNFTASVDKEDRQVILLSNLEIERTEKLIQQIEGKEG